MEEVSGVIGAIIVVTSSIVTSGVVVRAVETGIVVLASFAAPVSMELEVVTGIVISSVAAVISSDVRSFVVTRGGMVECIVLAPLGAQPTTEVVVDDAEDDSPVVTFLTVMPSTVTALIVMALPVVVSVTSDSTELEDFIGIDGVAAGSVVSSIVIPVVVM